MAKETLAKKVAVLGAGRVGRAIALDLAQDFEVRAVDANPEAGSRLRGKRLHTVTADVTRQDALARLIGDCDLVVSALPGHLGFRVLNNVIRCGKRIVDISFFPEDPLELDALAKEKGVLAAVDCGVAPGFSNMVLGHYLKEMTVTRFVCYVGGLPKLRVWPYAYKAPFSPLDVIEEYVRPARLMENNVLVTKPTLSEVEHLDFPGIGTLEAFNTDGLRTLLKTVKVPNMREKTLRYPGHSEYVKVLRDTGFFDSRPIEIRGAQVSPLELTSRVLFPHWQLAENEEEFTLMRILVEGEKNGKRVTRTCDLRDRYDPQTRLTSMARTTGYTCTAVARLILRGELKTAGILPPEFIGMDREKFESVTGHLKNKGIALEMAASA